MPLSSVLGAQSLVRPGVCTSATRPASPFDGQVIYESDTDTVRVWDGSVWDVVGTGVFTSTTRPASPYEGKIIYETDTDLVRMWNGSTWVTVGPTTIPAQTVRALDSAQITTTQSTSSTGYTDLGTVGPSVTLTTGTSAIVMFGARYNDDGNLGNDGFISYAVSGATTIAASDSYAGYGHQGFGGEMGVPLNYQHKVTSLNAGSNTFTLKYRKSGGSSSAGFAYRWLTVIAL